MSNRLLGWLLAAVTAVWVVESMAATVTGRLLDPALTGVVGTLLAAAIAGLYIRRGGDTK